MLIVSYIETDTDHPWATGEGSPSDPIQVTAQKMYLCPSKVAWHSQTKPAQASPMPAESLQHPPRACLRHHHCRVTRPGRYQFAIRGYGHCLNCIRVLADVHDARQRDRRVLVGPLDEVAAPLVRRTQRSLGGARHTRGGRLLARQLQHRLPQVHGGRLEDTQMPAEEMVQLKEILGKTNSLSGVPVVDSS